MWTESYPEFRNTFSQANTVYGKGKVSTKYISAKCCQEIIHCGDIFGTRLPFSVSCIGLTKGVLKGNNFEHLKIGGLQVVSLLGFS